MATTGAWIPQRRHREALYESSDEAGDRRRRSHAVGRMLEAIARAPVYRESPAQPTVARQPQRPPGARGGGPTVSLWYPGHCRASGVIHHKDAARRGSYPKMRQRREKLPKDGAWRREATQRCACMAQQNFGGRIYAFPALRRKSGPCGAVLLATMALIIRRPEIKFASCCRHSKSGRRNEHRQQIVDSHPIRA